VSIGEKRGTKIGEPRKPGGPPRNSRYHIHTRLSPQSLFFCSLSLSLLGGGYQSGEVGKRTAAFGYTATEMFRPRRDGPCKVAPVKKHNGLEAWNFAKTFHEASSAQLKPMWHFLYAFIDYSFHLWRTAHDSASRKWLTFRSTYNGTFYSLVKSSKYILLALRVPSTKCDQRLCGSPQVLCMGMENRIEQDPSNLALRS
jgi:hypothetical protein